MSTPETALNVLALAAALTGTACFLTGVLRTGAALLLAGFGALSAMAYADGVTWAAVLLGAVAAGAPLAAWQHIRIVRRRAARTEVTR